jgi:hypothetical protein
MLFLMGYNEYGIADVETGKAEQIYTSTDSINGYTWLP